MDVEDIFLQYIFRNKYLNRIIFGWVLKDRNPFQSYWSYRRYDQINSIQWMISFGYTNLLEYKINRGDYLFIDLESFSAMLKFTSATQYTLSQFIKNYGKELASFHVLEAAMECKNIEMVRALINDTTFLTDINILTSENIIQAVMSKNLQIFQMVWDRWTKEHPDNHLLDMDKDCLFQTIIKSQNRQFARCVMDSTGVLPHIKNRDDLTHHFFIENSMYMDSYILKFLIENGIVSFQDRNIRCISTVSFQYHSPQNLITLYLAYCNLNFLKNEKNQLLEKLEAINYKELLTESQHEKSLSEYSPDDTLVKDIIYLYISQVMLSPAVKSYINELFIATFIVKYNDCRLLDYDPTYLVKMSYHLYSNIQKFASHSILMAIEEKLKIWPSEVREEMETERERFSSFVLLFTKLDELGDFWYQKKMDYLNCLVKAKVCLSNTLTQLAKRGESELLEYFLEKVVDGDLFNDKTDLGKVLKKLLAILIFENGETMIKDMNMVISVYKKMNLEVDWVAILDDIIKYQRVSAYKEWRTQFSDSTKSNTEALVVASSDYELFVELFNDGFRHTEDLLFKVIDNLDIFEFLLDNTTHKVPGLLSKIDCSSHPKVFQYLITYRRKEVLSGRFGNNLKVRNLQKFLKTYMDNKQKARQYLSTRTYTSNWSNYYYDEDTREPEFSEELLKLYSLVGSQGDLRIFKVLLEASKYTQKDYEFRSVLLQAVGSGHLHILQYLSENIPNEPLSTYLYTTSTFELLIYEALQKRNPLIISILLDKIYPDRTKFPIREDHLKVPFSYLHYDTKLLIEHPNLFKSLPDVDKVVQYLKSCKKFINPVLYDQH
ncbi:hypothetical protein DLAC_05462 [Tieghemostelium lacteum]|uniref:Ankyrin repeat-containing protein n=1 Tax=Tieghemostelium lacteum TaxID=361077 RepID=A0A151ZG82_TIELA|nr:hypothetical protein DLAC_05462 [Tieghemostelium lacteum]|eukprot:KYQ92874.1 hypothetical protein DLAC_05462 [Tieghemostelium lacteum]